MRYDPPMSEWGNPSPAMVTPRNVGRTRGTETSQYPQEEKVNNDCASSGERTRRSPNQSCQGMAGVVGPPTTRKERVAEHSGKCDRSG